MSGFTREGPTDNEVRIIGVELAVREPRAGVEHELEMFECRHTIKIDPMNGHYYGRPSVRITVHTSRGDLTLTGNI